MLYFLLINYSFYNYLYGLNIPLVLFLLFSLLRLLYGPLKKIKFTSNFDLLAMFFFISVVLISIPGERFSFIEKDIILSLIIILLLKLYSNDYVNWKVIHLFFMSLSIIFFLYWFLIIIYPSASTIYLNLRGYEYQSYLFGLPRINNVFMIYPIFLVTNWRSTFLATTLVAPSTSIFLSILAFMKLALNQFKLKRMLIIIFLLTIFVYLLWTEFSDIWSALYTQKSISIANRLILEFPGLFGSLEYIRLSETLLFAIAQKYGFLASFLSLISIVRLFKMFKINNLKILISLLLVSANPTSIGMCLLFSYVSSRKIS